MCSLCVAVCVFIFDVVKITERDRQFGGGTKKALRTQGFELGFLLFSRYLLNRWSISKCLIDEAIGDDIFYLDRDRGQLIVS